MHDCIIGGGFLDGEPVLFCTKVSGFRLAAATSVYIYYIYPLREGILLAAYQVIIGLSLGHQINVYTVP